MSDDLAPDGHGPLPNCLYTYTARPAPPTPPLTENRKVDVAVVGGGLTGLSTALHLAEQGVDVAVLEAHQPGWGASGRNGGQVNPGLKHDPDQIERDFGPDLGRRMVTFSGNAPNVVFDLIRRYQIECEARQSGTLRAAYAPRAAEEVRRTAEQHLKRNLPVELMEHDAVRAQTGTDRYRCAFLDRRGGALNPLSYVRGLVQAAQNAGAQVYGGTRALGATRRGTVWEIDTGRATLTAERLVIGTNGYTNGFWPQLSRTVVPVYSAILATEPLPRELAREIMPGGSVLYENGAITVYYRLDAQGRLLMGGRSPMREVGMADMKRLQAYTIRLFPDLAGVRWTHCWNGQIAITTDHYPHLHQPDEKVMICLGYNGRGVAMSTAMGGEIARWATGTPVAQLDMPVTALKPIPFHRFWKLGVGVRILHGRARDFLRLS